MDQVNKRKLYRIIAIGAAAVVVLVGLIIGICALVDHGKEDSDTTKDSNDNFDEVFERMTVSGSETVQEKDYTNELSSVKTFCTKRGMMIKEGKTPSGFEAIGTSMKLIVTVEEMGDENFLELIDRLIWSTAPMNDTVAEKSTKMFVYEGLMDKDHPEYGYVYFRVFQCGDHYIFIQGLGDNASDPVIVEARNVADGIMLRVGIS